ncbi:hypothetical protein Bbelb_267490 [Branchiostoma belcheri]|nr:hypothetical protein Bbelb_267490 [Branchiostoma belcheri]
MFGVRSKSRLAVDIAILVVLLLPIKATTVLHPESCSGTVQESPLIFRTRNWPPGERFAPVRVFCTAGVDQPQHDAKLTGTGVLTQAAPLPVRENLINANCLPPRQRHPAGYLSGASVRPCSVKVLKHGDESNKPGCVPFVTEDRRHAAPRGFFWPPFKPPSHERWTSTENAMPGSMPPDPARNLAPTPLEVPSSSGKKPPFKILATGMPSQ